MVEWFVKPARIEKLEVLGSDEMQSGHNKLGEYQFGPVRHELVD